MPPPSCAISWQDLLTLMLNSCERSWGGKACVWGSMSPGVTIPPSRLTSTLPVLASLPFWPTSRILPPFIRISPLSMVKNSSFSERKPQIFLMSVSFTTLSTLAASSAFFSVAGIDADLAAVVKARTKCCLVRVQVRSLFI
ncbi:hypothetical protein FGO68_gene16716 [Halteria grandinella]|uniref:Uncharacterized protein n=1 Tax=Halteria grandinella TaxID=5974 RepID=A0A8J8NAA0_HALGN|nr:hypothetical protein FGO68_gene16716 [Halteria grandinella]